MFELNGSLVILIILTCSSQTATRRAAVHSRCDGRAQIYTCCGQCEQLQRNRGVIKPTEKVAPPTRRPSPEVTPVTAAHDQYDAIRLTNDDRKAETLTGNCVISNRKFFQWRMCVCGGVMYNIYKPATGDTTSKLCVFILHHLLPLKTQAVIISRS